jgi:phosphopantetheinyl transferase
MRKRNMRAFLKVRGKGATDQPHQITVTISPELSKLIAAEKERSGKTAEEIAEYAVRLHCVEMVTRIFEVNP